MHSRNRLHVRLMLFHFASCCSNNLSGRTRGKLAVIEDENRSGILKTGRGNRHRSPAVRAMAGLTLDLERGFKASVAGGASERNRPLHWLFSEIRGIQINRTMRLRFFFEVGRET
jgi:hypothetical protein